MPFKDRDKKLAWQREYQRKWVARRRADWFLGKSCVDCGSTSNLEVDHVDASIKISSNIWNWSDERRKAELSKCVSRCHDCHKKKTIENLEHAYGVKIRQSKLTPELVHEIRERFNSGTESKRGLARQFGVDEKAIRLLLKRETWKQVD